MDFQELSEQKEVEIVSMNWFQKFVGVIFSPTEAFKSIVAKPGIIIPIVVMIISALLVIVVQSDLYYDTILNTLQKTSQIMEQKQGVAMTAEQIVTQAASSTSVLGMVKVAASVLVMWVIMTAFYFLILKAIMKGKGSFKQFLSITGYVSTLGILLAIINLAMSYVTGKIEQDLSLAVFTDSLVGNLKDSTNFIYGFTYGVLKNFEVFNIWKAVLLAVGLKQLTELSSTKVNTVVIVFFIVSLIVSAAFLGVTELFTGTVSSLMVG